MASIFDDLVRGNTRGGYFQSVKKANSLDSRFLKCRGCPRVGPDCPRPECFKEEGKKKK